MEIWRKILGLRIRWILLIGIALRLVLTPFFSLTYDASVWYFLSNDVLKGLGIYASHTFTYPPLWAYTLLPLIRLLTSIVSPSTFGRNPDTLAPAILPGTLQPVVSPFFLTIIKLPLLFADGAGAYLVYKITAEFTTQERAKAVLTLWLLNPVIIWTNYGHGQFDMIPAVLTLAAAYLIIRQHSLSAGIALSLAILFKLYPLFLLPLYVVLLATRNSAKNARSPIVSVLHFTAGLLVSAVPFLLVPLLPINEGNLGFIQAIAARGNLIASIGGFSPFSILNLPQLSALKHEFILNSPNVNVILIAFEVILSFLIALWARRLVAVDPVRAVLQSHIFIIVMLFLTLPLTTPQYLVWIMPFLILSYGLLGDFFKRIWILGLVGFLFNPVQYGLGYPLYPAAVYLGFPSVSSLVTLNNTFALFSVPLLFLIQSIGFAAIVSCLKPSLNLLQTKLQVHEHPSPHHELNLTSKLPARINSILGLILLFLIASSAFTSVNALPSFTHPPSLRVDCCTGMQNSTFLRAQASLHFVGGTYPAEVDTLLIPLKSAVNSAPVYIYYDPTYPSSLTDLRGWTGLVDHLPFELQQRHAPLPIWHGFPSVSYTINADTLGQLFNSNASGTIVMPSGVLPNTVTISSLKAWLQHGGVLFWLGDRIGYYTSPASPTLDRSSSQNPAYAAQKQLFNGYIISTNATSLNNSPTGSPPYDAGTTVTQLSRNLNLNYPETLVGANLENLTKVGGTALGRINAKTSQTSIAVIPIGKGDVVIFGGGITYEFATSGEITVAADIAQIVSGFFLDSTLQPVFLSEILAPSQSVNYTLTLTLNIKEPAKGILLVAYSPDPFVAFFNEAIYPPPT